LGTWKNYENIKDCMEEIRNTLAIKNLNDWYRVSISQLYSIKCSGIINYFDCLYAPLKILFPLHNWDQTKFNNKLKKSAQWWLTKCVQMLLPGVELFEDFVYSFPNEKIEFDVWIPLHKLAIEYQGEQHFYSVSGMSTHPKIYGQRDKLKAELCIAHGIHLVEIPYWWAGDCQSLAETLKLQVTMFG